MANKRHECSLFPYIRQDVISLQEAAQKAGWFITAFDLPDCWKHSQGKGVTVAVLDTGCDLDHPDLVDNLLPGKNFVNKKAPPMDDCGHGTHATGIICAEDNSIGTIGVAPKAKVIPVKVLDKDGNGSLEIVAEGIRWAADNGANIMSLSLGSPYPIQQVRKAIQYAANKGIPVFCAAGNAGRTKDVFYPGAYPETIAIGSIDENFKRADYSNTGPNLDFMAPGTKIMSTVPPHWYAMMTGTSMACPWAVGVSALFLSYSREHDLGMPLKTVEDFRDVIRKYTIDVKDVDLNNKEFYEGFGIIDPRKLHKFFDEKEG